MVCAKLDNMLTPARYKHYKD